MQSHDAAPVSWLSWNPLAKPFAPVDRAARSHFEVAAEIFGPDVTDPQRDAAFATMLICPQHKFRMPTTLMKAARTYLQDQETFSRVKEEFRARFTLAFMQIVAMGGALPWPSPNVWLLLRASSQADLDQGVPELLGTPAAMRGVLLDGPAEPLELWWWMGGPSHGGGVYPVEPEDAAPAFDWIVLRGQAGPDAKPMSPDTARSVRKQCQDAQVPFYFEGWGEWAPMIESIGKPGLTVREWMLVSRNGAAVPATAENARADGNAAVMVRIGAKHSGRLLDSKVWDEMPEVAHAG